MRFGSKRARWALALALSAALSASAKADELPDGGSPDQAPAPTPAPTAALSIQLFERGTINPVRDARITIPGLDDSLTTDENGRATAPAISLANGTSLDIVIIADAYEPFRHTVTLVAGKTGKLEVRLIRRALDKQFQSTVRGKAATPATVKFELRDEELRNAPGTLGDPVRVIGLLPGVSTPIPVLPLYVVRGASPGANGFFLDGMRVPQLFHFVVGTGVTHPRLIDKLDFYPGSYDASFGRTSGAIIDTETRPARDGYHADIELRLYDISLLGEVEAPHGVRIAVSGHYGYPSFLIKLINKDVNLQYGDYQLRIDWKGLTVEALGSFDELKLAPSFFAKLFGGGGNGGGTLRLSFHRVQARWRGRTGRASYEAAVVGGYDTFTTFGGATVDKWSIGWRASIRARWRIFELAAGTDGELAQFHGSNFGTDARQSPDELGALNGGRLGVTVGAFAQADVEIVPERANLVLGVRTDVYHAGNVTLLSVDPRLLLRTRLLKQLELRAGVGLYQQPPSFPVALPSIDTFALQLGLQRSIQASVTIDAKLPAAFAFQMSGFYSRLYNINDVTLDLAGPSVCTSPPPESLSGIPAVITRQIGGHAYGMELMVRRTQGRVTGWAAYTLSRSERYYTCGLRPADFDQSHILNLVMQVRLPWRLLIGARLNVSTGRPYTLLAADGSSTTRNDARFPNYVQLDLRIDRDWVFKKWQLAAFIEIVNMTYSKTVFGVDYRAPNGIPLFTQPTTSGFKWILPSLGVRGYF